MLKLVDCSSFYKNEDLQVQVLNLEHKSMLVKQAADDRISNYVRTELKPRNGFMYLHINAMGAGEYYGSNKNGDYFPESNLKAYHKTFESFGHVFRHHINKDPAKSIGKVIFSIYNERMHRVELIAEVSKELGQDIEARIGMGEYPQTSMACKTPYDVCSICGNKARSRAEYCQHLTSQLNTYLPDGRRVMALNEGPLKFFDISIVIRPADITSSILVKVAGDDQGVLSSAELAEDEGLVEEDLSIKTAALRKASELIKAIEDGVVVDSAETLAPILEKLSDPSTEMLETLKKFPLVEVLNAMAHAGINPSIKFLAELIANEHLIEAAKGRGYIAEELIKSASNLSEVLKDSVKYVEHIHEKDANPVLVKVVMQEYHATSLNQDAVEKRASSGYLNWQIGQSATKPALSEDRLREVIKQEIESSNGLLKTLLTIGGAALVSKFLLSSMIDRKIEKMQGTDKTYAKIGLVKTSSVLSDQATFYIFKRGN